MGYIVIVSTESPLRNTLPLDALEAALSASNLDTHVHFVLSGLGILQLVKQQTSTRLDNVNLYKKLKLLLMYEIDDIYITQLPEQFNQEMLSDEIEVSLLSENEYASLLSNAQSVLVF
ncbi:DsrE family protein [Glaciecola sp. 1036]|uniref:DsrE family protein n=1 Tax=Alteromonadaceae TaxID=72275 RepID=UPI003D029C17